MSDYLEHPWKPDGPKDAIVPRAAGGALGMPSAAPSNADEGPQGLHVLRETLAMLLRARWTVLGVSFAIILVCLPTIWLVIKPKYRATAVVRVAPQKVPVLHDVDDIRFYPVFFQTQIATITNAAVLQSALDRADVQQTKWYRRSPRTLKTMLGSPPPNHIERLQSIIKVEQEGGTDLLSIQVTTDEAADVHVLANAVLEEYINYSSEKSDELEDLRFGALREEHRALVDEIQKLGERRGELSKQLGTDDPDIVRAQLAEQIGELEMEYKKLYRQYELMRWDLDGRNEALESAGGKTDSVATVGLASVPGQGRYGADSEWRSRYLDMLDAQQKYDEAGLTLGSNHPRMQELRLRLEKAQRRLVEREAELGPGFQASTAIVATNDRPGRGGEATTYTFLDQNSLVFTAARIKRELDVCGEQIQKLRAEQEEKGELAKQVAQISDQLRRKKEMEETIYNRIQTLEMEQKAPGRISVAAPALPVSEPYKDKRLMLSLMTLAGALFCGVVVAHLRANVDPKVIAANDIQRTSRVPFLGQVPHSDLAGTLLNDPNLLLQECMRMVRTALLERLDGGRLRSVMITSASSSAGKTTVAIELAKSFAHLGKRTLLVEADLRRPTLAKRIGLDNPNGLCALLSGESEESSVITPTGTPNLDVIFAGKRPPVLNPEMLANGVFGTCLTRWKKKYDIVLLDCPPILPVADSRILARLVDGAIMVSRSSHCRRTDVIQACADLTAAGGPLLGSVLVGVRPGAGYGYHYEYNYESTS